jgi:formate dehydrogenase major subunit
VFGSGGGTSSYLDMEETAINLLWGSNARETHPVMFLHMLKGVANGARLVVIDPRRTLSAEAAHDWLPVRVGADIALANAMGHAIIEEGLEHRDFIEHATTGFEEYRRLVAAYSPEWAEGVTGIPAARIREIARAYATARTGMICWTLGITEHHNAVDNVLALINLGLLTGKVGRDGCGLNPLRGQNNVQGGGDMGALPDRVPGFQPVEDDATRARFERAWGASVPPRAGWHQTGMLAAIERGDLRCLYVLGENPLRSDADAHHVELLLRKLDFLVVQDILRTATAELADVVLPGSSSWAEADGTVTNSERRVQLCRKALDPPGEARDDCLILQDIANRLGADWRYTSAEQIWDEVRALSPQHAGMSYARLAAHDGLQWPCYDETHPGERVMHRRLWEDPLRGPRVPFVPTAFEPPVDRVDADYPLLLTTGRRLEFFNTGVQTSLYESARHQEEFLELHPEDMANLGLEDGTLVRVTSRRGSVQVRARADRGLSRGLAFMTLHHPETVNTNLLTIHATDPKSGTAEFKATAVRVESVSAHAEGAFASVEPSAAGHDRRPAPVVGSQPGASESAEDRVDDRS